MRSRTSSQPSRASFTPGHRCDRPDMVRQGVNLRVPDALNRRRPRPQDGSKDGSMTGNDPRNWMWTEACAMIERAERLHRHFFQPGFSIAPEVTWEPPVDIFESDREVRIIAALPGVDPADIEVHLDANELVIAGIHRAPAVARDAVIH